MKRPRPPFDWREELSDALWRGIVAGGLVTMGAVAIASLPRLF